MQIYFRLSWQLGAQSKPFVITYSFSSDSFRKVDGSRCFRKNPYPNLPRYSSSRDIGLAKDMCSVRIDCVGIEFDEDGYFNLCDKTIYTLTGRDKYIRPNNFVFRKTTKTGKKTFLIKLCRQFSYF